MRAVLKEDFVAIPEGGKYNLNSSETLILTYFAEFS